MPEEKHAAPAHWDYSYDRQEYYWLPILLPCQTSWPLLCRGWGRYTRKARREAPPGFTLETEEKTPPGTQVPAGCKTAAAGTKCDKFSIPVSRAVPLKLKWKSAVNPALMSVSPAGVSAAAFFKLCLFQLLHFLLQPGEFLRFKLAFLLFLRRQFFFLSSSAVQGSCIRAGQDPARGCGRGRFSSLALELDVEAEFVRGIAIAYRFFVGDVALVIQLNNDQSEGAHAQLARFFRITL